jgi:creatinine amidohydrolase/Fe(II)-dependent formamide hydrolase-like protein
MLIASMALAAPAFGQTLRLTDLTSQQIATLDRSKTVVLMPGGVIEQHGPYLPSFTDGFMNEWWTERLAEAIVARPGWTALVFPMLPIGDGGANEIGGKFVFPGTYGLRVETLRAVYMDFATELGEQGFRWVFVIQNHGSPLHYRAIDQAGDYFRDTYGGHMVNLWGLEPKDALPSPKLPADVAKLDVLDIHAGASETSRMMFLKPGLVNPAVSDAPTLAVSSPADLVKIAGSREWPGYFGAPRYASAEFGEAVMRHRATLFNGLALQILDGKDDRDIPRFADLAFARDQDGGKPALAYDETVRAKQLDWLRKQGIEPH